MTTDNRHRGISLWQPYAWAVSAGHKTIETREHWRDDGYRGWVVICASRHTVQAQDVAFLRTVWGLDVPEAALTLGVAVAVARLVAVRPLLPSDRPAALCFGRGLTALVFEAVQPIAPVEVRGAPGLFPLSDPIIDAVRTALAAPRG